MPSWTSIIRLRRIASSSALVGSRCFSFSAQPPRAASRPWAASTTARASPPANRWGGLTRAEAQGAFRDLHAGRGRVGKALLLFQIDLQARGSPWARSPGAERPYGDPRNLIGLGPAKGGALGMRTRSAAPAFPTPTAVPG